jgi:hypothetical protein
MAFGSLRSMENPLSHFKVAQFRFILKPLDCICLPVYKGSTFRGAFGHAFKKVVCVIRDKICGSCLLKEKCVYSYVFETPLPSDTTKMRKYPFAPHPFVITPPLEEKKIYREGDVLCFELTLIGKSIDYLPYFIYTFDELGRIGIGKTKGKYQLDEVRAITPSDGSKDKGERLETIYCGKDKILKNTRKTMTIETLQPISLLTSTSASTLNLVFLTPTRLKFDGSLSPNP